MQKHIVPFSNSSSHHDGGIFFSTIKKKNCGKVLSGPGNSDDMLTTCVRNTITASPLRFHKPKKQDHNCLREVNFHMNYVMFEFK